jgi:hypothetical protein
MTPDDDGYDQLLKELEEEPLATEWWNDAESRADYGVSYIVVYDLDEHGNEVPAAWAGWIHELDLDEQLGGGMIVRCCNNYVRRGFRDRDPELYAVAYRRRHEQIVLRFGVPAYSFLYRQPIPIHLADGWEYDTPADEPGESRAYPGGELHQWWRLHWRPPGTTA